MVINSQLNKDESTVGSNNMFPRGTLVGETATLWEC